MSTTPKSAAPGRVRRRAVPDELVRFTPLRADRRLPLVARPTVRGVNLTAWAVAHRDTVEAALHSDGGVLFRGFGVPSAEAFQGFMTAMYTELVAEHERSSPRSRVSGSVFTSTDHPADQAIFPHNEMSYSHRWPMRIAFCCLTAAETGGATPIADTREVLRLIDPDIRETLVHRKVQYVRNYGGGFGLPWQTSFQTTDSTEVDAYCASAGMVAEWLGPDRLRTRRVASPVARHPVTGEQVWFNHATFFHVDTLEPALRDALTAELAPEDLPTHTFYGDGTEVEPDVMAGLRAAYRAATVSFPWEEGDVLLLDNMLAAHARAPFTGTRRVVVSMAREEGGA
ncbi:taurine catabolism dioxygenase TauD [Actinophytocola xinjiangensis]|uniref:Taurine catabolism dioxygenase TauD n=1 Tax=Actinophytocola xinjiangensis TaxID=485602 RepID=A0A7Z1AZA5_9PSEU|nr:TauD/TfdA family dioxygenase [Actinophytocola xinjiangensis]OLF11715.1 taurine catabolism dioxygenase TauD [Actinophytocola xinjiangensis]